MPDSGGVCLPPDPKQALAASPPGDVDAFTDAVLVWDFVTLTRQPVVQREQPGGPWFVALENECAWEPEHGLMLVLKEGRTVTKVSEYDGHLTNRHAFADDSIPEDAVYWRPA